MKIHKWPPRREQPQPGSYDDGGLNGFMPEHTTEDDLELYALNRLSEPGLGRVEEHLLVCELCRSRLTELEEFVQAMRSVLLGRAAFPGSDFS